MITVRHESTFSDGYELVPTPADAFRDLKIRAGDYLLVAIDGAPTSMQVNFVGHDGTVTVRKGLQLPRGVELELLDAKPPLVERRFAGTFVEQRAREAELAQPFATRSRR